MIINFGSDLHLEFQESISESPVIPSGDILILAGDVWTPWSKSKQHQDIVCDFFNEACKKNRLVVTIAGNHEHYGGNLYQTDSLIRKWYVDNGFDRVVHLENEHHVFEDVVIFGSTLWTDMKRQDPIVMWEIRRNMNDFAQIKSNTYIPYGGPQSILPEEIAAINVKSKLAMKQFLNDFQESELVPIVVTHHALTFESVLPCFRNDDCSYAYANSDLEQWLYDVDGFMHIHGHMHKNSKDQFGNVMSLCNARGYHGMNEEFVDASMFKFEQLIIEGD